MVDTTGYIEVRFPRDPSDPYCNLCGSKDEPKDAREVAFFTRYGQNVITLGLCVRHRLDLVTALMVGQSMETKEEAPS